MELPADIPEWLCSSQRRAGTRGLLGYPKTQSMKNFAKLGYRKAQQIGTHEKLAEPVKKRNGGRRTLRYLKAQWTGGGSWNTALD